MDPDETLSRLRRAVDNFDLCLEAGSLDSKTLAEYTVTMVLSFKALDEWLSKGGFAPQAWSRTEAGQQTPEKKQ